MNLFTYDFMQHAFIAGTLSAFISAVIGYFIVLRNQSFLGHALSHIGFAGATGAGLIGLSATSGQLLLTILGAIGIATLDKQTRRNDVVIGILLAFSLGLGILFLYLYNAYAEQAMSILFGDVLGVSTLQLKTLALFSTFSLIGIALIGRPLLFSTLEPELAEASGLSIRFISTIFLILVSIAVTEASITIGILLIFTLLIVPAAAALRLTHTFWLGLLLSIVFGLSATWVGILLAYFTNWPTSFWITLCTILIYLSSLLKN